MNDQKLRSAIARAFAMCAGHPDWSNLTEWPTDKCWKLNINGEVCRKKLGTCIHSWKPTKFGSQ